jgi:caffeoyl-CoA O-methyltransferase
VITPESIESYCTHHSSPCGEIFTRLDAETRLFAPKAHHMQIGNLEGALLRLIVKSAAVRRILEFGTFTGCSSLHFALALPEDALITTLDRDPQAVTLAKKFWAEAGVESKIESIVGDARDSALRISKEIGEGSREPYDLAFIDADKASYPEYMERSLECLRPGGMVLVDNVLWGGGVVSPEEPSAQTLHRFNERYSRDPRVEHVLIPIRDGLSWYRIRNT